MTSCSKKQVWPTKQGDAYWWEPWAQSFPEFSFELAFAAELNRKLLLRSYDVDDLGSNSPVDSVGDAGAVVIFNLL